MLTGFGVDLCVHRKAVGLTKKGNEVTVYTVNTDSTYEDNGYYKIKKIDIPIFRNPLKTDLHAAKRLIKLNNEDVDLWIAETYPFFSATWMLKRPVIVINYGVCSSMGMSIKRKLVFLYHRLTNHFIFFPKAARIIAISNYLKNQNLHLKGKTDMAYPGIEHTGEDSKDINIQEVRSKYGVNDNDILLFSVSRLNHIGQPYKGINDAIEIFQKLREKNKNLVYVITGYGEESDIEHLKSKGIKALLSAPDKEKNALLAASDIVISTSKWEGFGLPILEAQYQGTPTVAYYTTGHKETSISGKHGFLVKDQQEFCEKVQKLIDDKELRKTLGENAKQNARRFTWKNFIDCHHECIQKNITPIDQDYQKDFVDIITLNHNGKDNLKAFFDSAFNQTYQKINVTMVDNNSSDGSVDFVRENYPKVKIIEARKNLFFPRGYNLAIKNTNSEYIYFVNNDIIIDGHAVEKAVDCYKRNSKNKKVAAIAFKMYLKKFPNFLDSVGSVIRSDFKTFNRGIGQYDFGQYDAEVETFGACFGSVLIPRRLYEGVIGKLDNDYYGYYEDIDWCYRANMRGYKIITEPEAFCYHDHSYTSRKRPYNWKYYLIHRNYLWTVQKNAVKGIFIILTLTKIIDEFRQFLIKRRFASAKILISYFINFPKFMIKRIPNQLFRTVSDYDIFKYCKKLKPFFSPEDYQPIYSLDNIYNSLYTYCRHISDEYNNHLLEVIRITASRDRLGRQQVQKDVDALLDNLEKLSPDAKEKFEKNAVKLLYESDKDFNDWI